MFKKIIYGGNVIASGVSELIIPFGCCMCCICCIIIIIYILSSGGLGNLLGGFGLGNLFNGLGNTTQSIGKVADTIGSGITSTTNKLGDVVSGKTPLTTKSKPVDGELIFLIQLLKNKNNPVEHKKILNDPANKAYLDDARATLSTDQKNQYGIN